jgi:hypothetical protein
VFIHPYFPILPPPPASVVLRDRIAMRNRAVPHPNSDSTSPLVLAILAILSLIPHPDDPIPTSRTSISLRRGRSQSYAVSAQECIEIGSELVSSSFEPSNSLCEERPPALRSSFHPHVPTDLESIIALDLLSVYEYAQRGNLKKMGNRAAQALTAAMDLKLYAESGDDDPAYVEAKRRVWWMTVGHLSATRFRDFAETHFSLSALRRTLSSALQ